MTRQTILANRSNYGNTRSTSAIKYIVVHYTGNDGDTALGNANYFKNNIVKTSAHYFVDDNIIIQSVPDNYVAWSVGGSKYPDTGKTGGGKHHGLCTNTNSVSVEMCDTVKNGKSDFTDKTISNTIILVRELMNKLKIDINHVIRHFDVTGKICPKPYVDESAWQEFKNMIVGDDEMAQKERIEELTGIVEDLQQRIRVLENPMIYNYIDVNMPDYARPTIQKLVGRGSLVGNEKGELNLSEDLMRTLVILDREHVFK